MYEVYSPNHSEWEKNLEFDPLRPQMSVIHAVSEVDIFAPLKGKKVAWVGDTNNVLNDMLVTYPRLGMTLSVASPKGYDKVDERVWARV
jgi:ornithine carbamoyltransferase